MANPCTCRMAARLPGTAVGASSTAEADFLNAAGVAATFYLPGSNCLLNRTMILRAVGRVTGGTTTNVTVKIYVGATAIASTGTIACNSASGNFLLEAQVVVDSTSAKMGGLLKGYLNATAVAQAILSSLPTSLDLATEGTNVVKATAQFSASDAGNAAVLQELSLDVL